MTHTVRRGLDLPLSGSPEQKISGEVRTSKVAIVAADCVGMRPRLQVQEGDVVRRGQLVFEDRKNDGVRYTAPVSGRVAAVNRGEKRVFLSMVFEPDDSEQRGEPNEVTYETYSGRPVEELGGEHVRAMLVESGLWTALRTRPFSKVPAVKSAPRSVFVTAIDTSPLAPSVDAAVAGREDDFRAGLAMLTKLGGRAVHLCVAPGSDLARTDIPGVDIQIFKGKHPAGNPGLHIHRVDPVDLDRVAWHVGYQDVIAMGRFAREGVLRQDRVISLAGPSVKKPRLLKVPFGACIDELVKDELKGPDARVLSGSVWNGFEAQGEVLGYLGRHHNQVTALPRGGQRRFLGWLAPGLRTFSAYRLFMSKFLPIRDYDFTTEQNGSLRAMVPIGGYERVMGFDLMPTFLLRSILAGDVERAEELGVLELAEEDVATCTFVCPSKIDYGTALREMLTLIEKES